MKTSYRIFPILIALIAGNESLATAQDNRPNLSSARRSMLLYMTDPFDGTWVLNVAKSKLTSGPALKLKSDIIEIEEISGGIECILVSSDGKSRRTGWTAKYDGRDYPALMAPLADAVALKRIDENTVDAIYKREGKEILTERWVISGNGRILTMTQTDGDPEAKGRRSALVYDKK